MPSFIFGKLILSIKGILSILLLVAKQVAIMWPFLHAFSFCLVVSPNLSSIFLVISDLPIFQFIFKLLESCSWCYIDGLLMIQRFMFSR